MINQNRNNGFDLGQFKRIEDIIYLDEPILTHLVKNEKQYLLYLVDTLEDKDIYLLLEVEEKTIFNYLTKQIALKKVITTNNNFIYRIEQDFNGEILNVEITQSEVLPENYLPTEDSYLNYIPLADSYYYNFIKEFETRSYLHSLREEAFYIKLAPKNSKYSDTIGFNELAGELLKNLSLSFKNFLKADFFESFKEKQTDEKKLSATFNRLADDLDYRMVDVGFGSFEIGLAVDKVMKSSIEDRKLREWAIEVGYKYKNIVLDEDYDEETVQTILSSYNEEDRRKIFEPIFRITESSKFDLKIKDSKNEEYSKIIPKNKSVIKRIVPPKIEISEAEELKEYEIIQVTTIKEKDKVKKSIRLDENTLFESYESKKVILKKEHFSKFNYNLNFEVEIPLEILSEKGYIILKTEYEEIEFERIVADGKLDEGIKQIVTSIYEYILSKL